MAYTLRALDEPSAGRTAGAYSMEQEQNDFMQEKVRSLEQQETGEIRRFRSR